MSPASSSDREPLAAIFGLAGTELSATEREFFRERDPLGFILFQRNCDSPDQVRGLVANLRACIGRDDAPVLIDQEGGRVARLRPPHWPEYPAASRFAGTAAPREAAFLGARIIADDLAALGITVDCAPVLDLPIAGADAIIGDRAYGNDPASVASLGRAACEGFLAGGVLPIVKHIPGHGRARVDSHQALPVVDEPVALLAAADFAPFHALKDMPWAMTAHIVYSAIDSERPATLSPRLIGETIRASIGFGGVLISDDLSMRALPGGLAGRASGALAAGCDLVLHCNGTMSDMIEIANAIDPVSQATQARLAAAELLRLRSKKHFDRAAAETRFAALLQGVA
jgi:beta-N-acetylhexosaminidase